VGQPRLKPSDLTKILGGRSRVSEVLNKKRKLTVEMMRSLHNTWPFPPTRYWRSRNNGGYYQLTVCIFGVYP
jgi:hypothetical protein